VKPLLKIYFDLQGGVLFGAQAIPYILIICFESIAAAAAYSLLKRHFTVEEPSNTRSSYFAKLIDDFLSNFLATFDQQL
jgi:hypothetical protein